jgi:hypothetical protein
MTVSDWLNLLGSLGLVSAGSLFGSLITILIKYWLDKNKLSTERQGNLQKEIYFKLQEQAGKLFEDINLMNRQVEDMSYWLRKGVFDLDITKVPITERLAKISTIQVYFSVDVLKKYDQLGKTSRKISEIYFEAGKMDQLSYKACDSLNVLLVQFNNEADSCVRAVLEEVRKNKESIK